MGDILIEVVKSNSDDSTGKKSMRARFSVFSEKLFFLKTISSTDKIKQNAIRYFHFFIHLKDASWRIAAKNQVNSLLLLAVLGGLASCANEPKLKLYAEPQETVRPGETIIVYIGGNIIPNDIDWYREGSKDLKCENLASCEFTYYESSRVGIKVSVSVKKQISEITGLLQKKSSHADGKITLTWEEESMTTSTTSTSTTTTLK
ncbi:MAG: hypothetical protein HQM14_16215 [SAR324 cluster bacterium]|nr:hypothetical protein [SAR324 cluster bacterium]